MFKELHQAYITKLEKREQKLLQDLESLKS